MDARSEKVLRDRSNARNFKLNSEIEVNRKNKTLYSKRGGNVKSGIKQQIV
jgi:hypothetical protein